MPLTLCHKYFFWHRQKTNRAIQNWLIDKIEKMGLTATKNWRKMGLARWVGIDGSGESRAPILLRPIFPRLRQKCFRRRCQCHCHCQSHCLKFQHSAYKAGKYSRGASKLWVYHMMANRATAQPVSDPILLKPKWLKVSFVCDMSQNKSPMIYAILLVSPSQTSRTLRTAGHHQRQVGGGGAPDNDNGVCLLRVQRTRTPSNTNTNTNTWNATMTWACFVSEQHAQRQIQMQ